MLISCFRASEELAPESMRDEIIWLLCLSLDLQLGWFIMVV